MSSSLNLRWWIRNGGYKILKSQHNHEFSKKNANFLTHSSQYNPKYFSQFFHHFSSCCFRYYFFFGKKYKKYVFYTKNKLTILVYFLNLFSEFFCITESETEVKMMKFAKFKMMDSKERTRNFKIVSPFWFLKNE